MVVNHYELQANGDYQTIYTNGTIDSQVLPSVIVDNTHGQLSWTDYEGN